MIRSESCTAKMMMRLIAFFLLVWNFPLVWTFASPSLNVSSRLYAGDRLVSPRGHFELGIFLFPKFKYYLCIRYGFPIEQVVTRVANRDTPLSNNSYLKLSSVDGNLRLFNSSNRPPLWISSNTSNADVERAQLLDSGNLVLVDGNGTIKWESFRNSSITDTLLPGQYLYRNETLTSWLTRENPTTRGNGSSYTFGWGTGANLQLAWTPPLAGVLTNWTDGRYVPAPDHVKNTISNVDFVYLDTTHGSPYFPSFPADTVILSGGDALSNTTLKRLTLDTDGGLRIWQWTVGISKVWDAVANWVVSDQGSQCFAFGTCGPFGLCNMTPPRSLDRAECSCIRGFYHIDSHDPSSGCTPYWVGSSCGSLSYMDELNGVDIRWGVDYRHFETDAASCREECRKDCKCAGAVHSRVEAKCWMKTGILYNIGYPNANRTAFVKCRLGLLSGGAGSTGVTSAALGLLLMILFLCVGIGCCIWKSSHLRGRVISCLNKFDDVDGGSSSDNDDHPVGGLHERRTSTNEVTTACVLSRTDFLTRDSMRHWTAALDKCDMQRQEFVNLLPVVSIFKLLCNYTVNTLSPVTHKNFEHYRKILEKLRQLLLQGDGEISSNLRSRVSFCFESLADLTQRFQLVVELFRKCESPEWYKSALELADVRPPKGMERWSQFSLAIQSCEWSLDLVDLAFHALEKLLTEGTYSGNDASFRWVDTRGRMVLERAESTPHYNSVLLRDCRDLEEEDLKTLTKKLKNLEASERNKKRFYQGLSVAHEIASFLGTKLEGPTPAIGTYLPYSFTKIDPASLSHGKYLNVETLHCAGNTVIKDKWNTINVAVKTVKSCDRSTFEREAAILGMVQHPNVVRLIGCAFIDKVNTGLLVMELMDDDLRKVIDSRLGTLPRGSCPFLPSVAIDIMLQIAQAMLYLRKHKVLHRDLKAKNILVNICKLPGSSLQLPLSDHEHFVAKLADFGLAKCQPQSSDVATLNAGTTGWRAPEVFNLHDAELVQNYKWPADVYSYGMTCYEILTGKIPFQDEPRSNSGADLHIKIMQGVRPPLDNLSMEVPHALKDLIRQCWETEPSARPKSFEIIVKKLWECKVQATLPTFLQTHQNLHSDV